MHFSHCFFKYFFVPCLFKPLFLLFSSSVTSSSPWPRGPQHTWTTAYRASLSFTISWSLLRFISIESVMLSLSAAPFSSCPQSFPATQSFPTSWLFALGGQSTETSASVFPMIIQGWFSLRLTALISLQSLEEGRSRVSSPPQFKSMNFLALSFLYGPTLTSIQYYWKNHCFDYTDLFIKEMSFLSPS